MSRPKDQARRSVAVNKKAYFKFQIDEKFEAGIQLLGTEVKSLRDGNVSFGDSYAHLKGVELYLRDLHIAHYPPAARANHQPTRPRKLLLRGGELSRLAGTTSAGPSGTARSSGRWSAPAAGAGAERIL